MDEYVRYDVSAGITLEQLIGQFFDDVNVLTRMLRVLAVEVSRAAQRSVDRIKELEEKVRKLEARVRDLELEDGDP
jgi:hypothetical protein